MQALDEVRSVSTMTPRLQAKSVGVFGGFAEREREGLVILDIFRGRPPISMNSVLEGFREGRLEVFQDDMSEIVLKLS